MMLSETPFFLSFFGRSGSTFLVDLLDSHPDVSCLREIFHEFETEEGWTRRPQFTTRESVRAQLDRIYTSKYKASGFKYKYPTQYQFYPDVYEYLLERADKLHIIYLHRKNLLKAAISKQNQLRLINMGKNSNLTEKDNVDLGKIHLDIDRALGYMNLRQEYDRKYYEELKRFQHKYVLAYEDLLQDTRSVLKDVFSFLNVDSYYEASAKTVKITNDDIQKAVANYEELVQTLTGTEYEQFLTEDGA